MYRRPLSTCFVNWNKPAIGQAAFRVQRKIHDEFEASQQLQQAGRQPIEFIAARNEQIGIGSFACPIDGTFDTVVHGLIVIFGAPSLSPAW